MESKQRYRSELKCRSSKMRIYVNEEVKKKISIEIGKKWRSGMRMYVGERESEILSLLISAHDFIPKRVTFLGKKLPR